MMDVTYNSVLQNTRQYFQGIPNGSPIRGELAPGATTSGFRSPPVNSTAVAKSSVNQHSSTTTLSPNHRNPWPSSQQISPLNYPNYSGNAKTITVTKSISHVSVSITAQGGGGGGAIPIKPIASYKAPTVTRFSIDNGHTNQGFYNMDSIISHPSGGAVTQQHQGKFSKIKNRPVNNYKPPQSNSEPQANNNYNNAQRVSQPPQYVSQAQAGEAYNMEQRFAANFREQVGMQQTVTINKPEEKSKTIGNREGLNLTDTKREIPLDLSVKTIRQSADSTGLEEAEGILYGLKSVIPLKPVEMRHSHLPQLPFHNTTRGNIAVPISNSQSVHANALSAYNSIVRRHAGLGVHEHRNQNDFPSPPVQKSSRSKPTVSSAPSSTPYEPKFQTHGYPVQHPNFYGSGTDIVPPQIQPPKQAPRSDVPQNPLYNTNKQPKNVFLQPTSSPSCESRKRQPVSIHYDNLPLKSPRNGQWRQNIDKEIENRLNSYARDNLLMNEDDSKKPIIVRPIPINNYQREHVTLYPSQLEVKKEQGLPNGTPDKQVISILRSNLESKERNMQLRKQQEEQQCYWQQKQTQMQMQPQLQQPTTISVWPVQTKQESSYLNYKQKTPPKMNEKKSYTILDSPVAGMNNPRPLPSFQEFHNKINFTTRSPDLPESTHMYDHRLHHHKKVMSASFPSEPSATPSAFAPPRIRTKAELKQVSMSMENKPVNRHAPSPHKYAFPAGMLPTDTNGIADVNHINYKSSSPNMIIVVNGGNNANINDNNNSSEKVLPNTQETACYPPRKRLFSRTDNGSSRNSVCRRSSSETSVFDFKDSDSDEECTSVKLHKMRKKIKMSKKTDDEEEKKKMENPSNTEIPVLKIEDKEECEIPEIKQLEKEQIKDGEWLSAYDGLLDQLRDSKVYAKRGKKKKMIEEKLIAKEDIKEEKVEVEEEERETEKRKKEKSNSRKIEVDMKKELTDEEDEEEEEEEEEEEVVKRVTRSQSTRACAPTHFLMDSFYSDANSDSSSDDYIPKSMKQKKNKKRKEKEVHSKKEDEDDEEEEEEEEEKFKNKKSELSPTSSDKENKPTRRHSKRVAELGKNDDKADKTKKKGKGRSNSTDSSDTEEETVKIEKPRTRGQSKKEEIKTEVIIEETRKNLRNRDVVVPLLTECKSKKTYNKKTPIKKISEEEQEVKVSIKKEEEVIIKKEEDAIVPIKKEEDLAESEGIKLKEEIFKYKCSLRMPMKLIKLSLGLPGKEVSSSLPDLDKFRNRQLVKIDKKEKRRMSSDFDDDEEEKTKPSPKPWHGLLSTKPSSMVPEIKSEPAYDYEENEMNLRRKRAADKTVKPWLNSMLNQKDGNYLEDNAPMTLEQSVNSVCRLEDLLKETYIENEPEVSSAPKKKARRKCRSSGFDYLKKKKKTIKKDDFEEGGEEKKKVIVMRPTAESVEDIQNEIKSWVVNKGVGETILHRAARLGYLDVSAYCLEKLDYPPSPTDNAGYTPLHEACTKGHYAIAKILLMYGADVHASAKGGIRPLHEAVDNGYTEIVRLLLAYGADPSLATYGGQTPLSLANDENEEIRELIAGHVDDLKGETDKPWSFRCYSSPGLEDFDVLADAPSPVTEERVLEFEISEDPLLTTFYLMDENSQPWVLYSDLPLPTARLAHDNPNKHRIRRISRSDFEEKVQCTTFLEHKPAPKTRATYSPVTLVQCNSILLNAMRVKRIKYVPY